LGALKNPFQILCQFGICYQLTPATTTTATTTIKVIAPASVLSLKNVFTRTLYLGMTGNDVKQLQIFLNLHGFTVAKTGAGSKGHETMLYGPATQAAVSRFQATYAKDILYQNGFTKPTGTFGAASRTQAIKISMGQN
jgi:peptidoglycan hydrolase-like protein with peptidoglycan-binding domain